MNLDTLSLYCDVIRSGSFSLGAASHRISQSAASQAVRQLEEELGAQLIDRTKRPFMVTPEQGAATSVFLATVSDATPFQGAYVIGRRVVEPDSAARNDDLGERLWAESARLVGL